MFEILILLGICYLLSKCYDARAAKGKTPRRRSREHHGGLRWMGNRKRQNKNKSYWD